MTQDFDPFDLDAIERAQLAADGEADQNPVIEDDEGDADQTDADQVDNGEAKPAEVAGQGAEVEEGATQVEQEEQGQATQTEATEVAKPEGVASKDGKRVLPYSALTAARFEAQATKRERDAIKAENEALKAELEAAKSGKATAKPEKADDELSDEELAEMEVEFPQLARVARVVKATAAKAVQPAGKDAQEPAAQQASATEPTDDPVQEAIDSVPDLLTWQTNQAEHASKFQRAVDWDNTLKASPKWANKPMAERFAEATRLVREEFDIAEPAPASLKQDEDPKQQVAKRREAAQGQVQNASRRSPNTLSDLNGSARPPTDSMAALTPTAMLNRMLTMSNEDILASLDRAG
jgi:hypothetical protein